MGRLSISLDTDNCLLELEPGPSSPHTIGLRSSTLDPRRQAHRHPHVSEAKSFKSSVCLPQVRGFTFILRCSFTLVIFPRCIRNRLSACELGVTGSCLTGRVRGGVAVGGAVAW